ncbi:hypothetical protein [Candidatus Accumulibacter sp. ACC003]|nr:hypothetical protein [Candidatus Accumulibacter sp. ACC003]
MISVRDEHEKPTSFAEARASSVAVAFAVRGSRHESHEAVANVS